MEAAKKTILYYRTVDGAMPFKAWRDSITDKPTRAMVDARIARLRSGNFGNSKPVGDGVSETKIDFGPGYRIYYGAGHGDTVILLRGGDKSTQQQDIMKARAAWNDYKRRKMQSTSER